MEANALNYNPVATISDYNSCIFPSPEPQVVPGCRDPKALNYNPNATEYDNSCVYPEEENTCYAEITETPVDTVGAKPAEDCRLDMSSLIGLVNAGVVEINENMVTVQWVIEQLNGNMATYLRRLSH